jgi:hypothetical protein
MLQVIGAPHQSIRITPSAPDTLSGHEPVVAYEGELPALGRLHLRMPRGHYNLTASEYGQRALDLTLGAASVRVDVTPRLIMPTLPDLLGGT